MNKANENSLSFPKAISPSKIRDLSNANWNQLCELYLPIQFEDSIWRFSRETRLNEPSQGWKFHISATILEACDLFEKIAPFLISRDVQFKAPKSLEELAKINCGLHYGYWQVGKFMTVYPATASQAIGLAKELDDLTSKFISISVPFDNQYSPNSSVFYRYGAFQELEMLDEHGESIPAIKNPGQELVYDDRFQPVPDWLPNPFQKAENYPEPVETPLVTTYKVFRAITQRGKGGTYQALDFSTDPPRFCIVKEGRRYGEVFWNGQDGRYMLKNECKVLSALGRTYKAVPQILSTFEIDGNFYLAMEFVEGASLFDLMKVRRRRYSIKEIIMFAIEIAEIIARIHQAGWIWNDCKPANLIVTPSKSLRPIDFEGAYRINQPDPFDWKTEGFSKQPSNQSSAFTNDFYSLGAVVYFLLTGKIYDTDAPLQIKNLRRQIPPRFQEIIENLLVDSVVVNGNTAVEIKKEFEKVLNSL